MSEAVFFPEQYSFGDEDWGGFNAEQITPVDAEEESWWDAIVSGLSSIWNATVGIFTFLIACLSFNIPMMPPIVRIIILAPFHIGMAWIIGDYVKGLIRR